MLDLNLIKHHLNVEPDFTEDDMYILSLAEAAEAVVKKDLTIACEDELYTADGEMKPDIRHAMLLLIGTWYASRESIVYGVPQKLPHAYQYLIDLNKNYSTYYIEKRG